MPVIAAYMVPHPPMILPEVGRGGEKQIETTTAAYLRAADFSLFAAHAEGVPGPEIEAGRRNEILG